MTKCKIGEGIIETFPNNLSYCELNIVTKILILIIWFSFNLVYQYLFWDHWYNL